ncbi:MAG: aromatic ring-hydroxylating dioxygenase subunit alpha [Acidimicrobiales bacterium]
MTGDVRQQAHDGAIPDGARFVQGLLDAESRPVPSVLRATSFVDMGDSDIPRERYISQEIHDLEVEKVWGRAWQVACREEEIPDEGDIWVHEIAGTSLIVLRTAGGLKAFYNSCLHRGTQLRTSSGNASELRCPFHGFTWNLDGTFRGMPCEWDFPHIDRADFGLPQIRTASWGGFVFVNLDPDAQPLDTYLEVLPEHFSAWPLEDRYTSAHVMRELPCNWKVALEAFIESYHTVAVHPQLLKTSGDAQTEYDVYPGIAHINRMITPVGVASTHRHDVSEQQIVDAMFVTRDDPDAKLAEGQSARGLLADRKRRELGEKTGGDFSELTDCEALDAIEYFCFPNFVPWAGYTTPLAYRFRPFGNDVSRSIMDVWILDPLPFDKPRPRATVCRRLGAEQSWADAPELGFLGPILDQDTQTLVMIERGLETSRKQGVTLARYQESRIRHFHQTLGHYLSR